MAQLITLALLMFGAIILYKRFVGDARKLAEKTKRQEKERETGATGTLIKDPTAGEYRVKKEDEV